MTYWFLVVSLWTFDGQPKVIGGGNFSTKAECSRAAEADYKAKIAGVAALKIHCEESAPRPKDLPEPQPHVPGKVSA